MKNRYNQFNPKRRFIKPDAEQLVRLGELAKSVAYGGNPEHKKNPGDFGLTPPSDPRRGKSLCDAAGIFSRTDALALLQEGLRRGLVSDRHEDGWPRNIWAVTSHGMPLEAQLENPVLGSYHGYPMPSSDPMATAVVEKWERAHG
jgi:hypothetical protein